MVVVRSRQNLPEVPAACQQEPDSGRDKDSTCICLMNVENRYAFSLAILFLHVMRRELQTRSVVVCVCVLHFLIVSPSASFHVIGQL